MPRQYRIHELKTPVNTFTPQYSDDGGVTWVTIQNTTALSKPIAEKVIEDFIAKGSGNTNEIFHSYSPNLKPLFD